MLATVTTPTEAALRDAVNVTNASATDNTIDFSFSNQVILLQSGQLNILDHLTINGNNNTFAVDNEEFRVLNVTSTVNDRGENPADHNVILNSVTIAQGRTDGEHEIDLPFNENFYSGGGIRFNSTGTLTLNSSSVDNNGAIDFGSKGGGIFAVGPVVLQGNTSINNNYTGLDKLFGDSGELGAGGGVFSETSVTVNSSSVTNNKTFGYGAGGAGIASFGDVILDGGSVVSGNYTDGRYSDGGGIFAGGFKGFGSTSPYGGADVIVRNGSIVENNHTKTRFSKGGGIAAIGNVTIESGSFVRNNRTEGKQSHGGGIYAGSELMLDNSTLSGNHTVGGTTKLAEIVCKVGLDLAKKVIGANLPAHKVVQITSFIYDHLSALNQVPHKVVDNDPCPEAFGSGGYGGGAAGRTLTILNNSTVSGNFTDGYGAKGGALFSLGDISITDSNITGNETRQNQSPGGAAFAAQELTVTNSTVDNNRTKNTNSSGGALAAQFSTGKVIIENSLVTGNHTAGTGAGGSNSRGGAVFAGDVTIRNSELSGNRTTGHRSAGGAVFGENSVFVSGSVFSGNFTTGDTGNISGGSKSQLTVNQSGGGAITSPAVTAIGSTFVGNFVSGDDADGGAIYSNNTTLTNSTLSRNSATHDEANGGGVFTFDGNIVQSTVSGNLAGSTGGGIYSLFDLTLANSIVLGNLAQNQDSVATGPGNNLDVGHFFDGTLSGLGGNLVSRVGQSANDVSAFATSGIVIGSSSTEANVVDVFASNSVITGTSTLAADLSDNLGLQVGPNNIFLQSAALEENNSNPAIDATMNVIDLINLPSIFESSFGEDTRGFIRRFDFKDINDGNTDDLGAVEVHTLDSLTTVTNGNNAGSGSLRAAIDAANTIAGTNTITFDDSSSFTIQLQSALPDIIAEVIIDASNGGLGHSTVLAAANGSRIFNFTASTGDLVIRNLSMEGGKTVGNNATFNGGGIRSLSTGEVRLVDSFMRNNATEGLNALGGAIFGNGTVILVDSELTSNTTLDNGSHGGAIAADIVKIYGGIVAGNSTGDTTQTTTQGIGAKGGAIYANDITLAGVNAYFNRTFGSNADGGALFASGDVKLYSSILTGNYTRTDNSSGGSVSANTLTADSSFIKNSQTYGSFSPGGGLYATSQITLYGSSVENNRTLGNNSFGGGLASFLDVEVINSSVINNGTTGQAAPGGGLAAGRNATVIGSTISNNHTADQGSNGGGMNVGFGVANGILELASSTVTGNSTGSSVYTTDGGGIQADSAFISDSIVLGNFSNNSASPVHEVKATTLAFNGQNIVGENSGDFNDSAFINVSNASATNVFGNGLTASTAFDSNGDGFANATATGHSTGIPKFNGGLDDGFNNDFKTIALNPSSSNLAVDGTDAPVSLFSFEGDANDGFGVNNGTFEGGLTANVPGFDGVSANAIDIGGDGSKYVQLANPLTIGDKSHTVETWIQVPQVGLGGVAAGQRVGVILGTFGNTSLNVNWEIHDDGQMRVFWKNGERNIFGSTDLRDGQWHHVAFVRDTAANQFRFYVDGVQETTSGVNNAGTNFTFTQPSRIGQDNRSSTPIAFHGSIDELTIHESALTEEQVRVRAGFDSRNNSLVRAFDRVVAPPGSVNPSRMDIGAFESTAEVESLVVTTFVDVTNGFDGFTSLREAVAFANSGDADGVNGDHDTITFAADIVGDTAALFDGQLNISQSLTIDASSVGSIAIDALEQSRILEFTSATGDLELTNVTLMRGDTSDVGGAIKFGSSGTLTLTDSRVTVSEANSGGGGIYAMGDVVLDRSVVDGNRTTGNGAYGGGVLSLGSITATNSTIYGNATFGDSASGGGLAGIDEITLLNSAVISNFVNSNSGEGGGLLTAGDVNVTNSILLGNFALGSNDEIAAGGSGFFNGNNLVGEDQFAFNASSFPNVENAEGRRVLIENSFDAAFNAQTLPAFKLLPTQTNPALDAGLDSLAPAVDSWGNPRTVDLPTIADQVASNFVDLGPVELQLTEEELGSTIVTTSIDVVDSFDFVTSFREAAIYANDALAGPFENGDADGDGSVIDSITFAAEIGDHFEIPRTINLTSEIAFTQSVSIEGTGEDRLTFTTPGANRIFNLGSAANAAEYFIQDVALTNGDAGTGTGGAINLVDANDRLVINGVRFLTNFSNGGGAIFIANADYEIYNSSFVGNTANFSGSAILAFGNSDGWVSNTTFSANVSNSGSGAIFIQTAGNQNGGLQLRNSTIADTTGHGVQLFAGDTNSLSSVFIGNTILSNNSLANVITGGAGTKQFFSLGSNLSDDGSGNFAAAGDMTNVDPLLVPIDFNAPTLHHSLLPTSSAIDQGENSLVIDKSGIPLLTDQRGEGFDRIFDALDDGAATVDIGAFEVNHIVDQIAPTVESIVINGGDVQRSMVSEITVTFSEFVNVFASSFTLQNVDTGQFFTPDVSVQGVGGKTVATLTFSGSGIIGGSLPDGDYTLTILDSVTDTSGNSMDGDNDGNAGGNATDDFFRFYGDVNGDKTVNIIDFFQFRNAFSGTYNAAFDYNGDGVVNIIDFFQFRSRFGSSL